MAETAAHLVDSVLPEVPIRQWVLALPFSLRYRLAYDRRLLTPVLAAFVRAVFASHKRRAREELEIRRAKCGAVTFVQRFGGALNLNVHFHSLVIEGVYEVLPNSLGIGHAGRAILFRAHAKDEARISQGAIVENKRLGAALGWIAERQRLRDIERMTNPKISIRQKKRLRATTGLTA